MERGKEFIATPEQRKTIARMAANGMNLDLIGHAIGVDESTIRSHPDLVKIYREKFAESIDKVCNSILSRAMMPNADPTIQIFVAKTRARWNSHSYLPPCRLKGRTYAEKRDEINQLLESGRLSIENHHKLMETITKEFQVDEQMIKIQELEKFKEVFEKQLTRGN